MFDQQLCKVKKDWVRLKVQSKWVVMNVKGTANTFSLLFVITMENWVVCCHHVRYMNYDFVITVIDMTEFEWIVVNLLWQVQSNLS